MSSRDSDRGRSGFSAKQYIPWARDAREGTEWKGPRVSSFEGKTPEETIFATENDEPGEWISTERPVELAGVRCDSASAVRWRSRVRWSGPGVVRFRSRA